MKRETALRPGDKVRITQDRCPVDTVRPEQLFYAVTQGSVGRVSSYEENCTYLEQLRPPTIARESYGKWFLEIKKHIELGISYPVYLEVVCAGTDPTGIVDCQVGDILELSSDILEKLE